MPSAVNVMLNLSTVVIKAQLKYAIYIVSCTQRKSVTKKFACFFKFFLFAFCVLACLFVFLVCLPQHHFLADVTYSLINVVMFMKIVC